MTSPGQHTYTALGTRELLECLAQRQLSGEPVNAAAVEGGRRLPFSQWLSRFTRQPTGRPPTLRYRGYLFTLAIVADVNDLHITRESGIVTVE